MPLAGQNRETSKAMEEKRTIEQNDALMRSICASSSGKNKKAAGTQEPQRPRANTLTINHQSLSRRHRIKPARMGGYPSPKPACRVSTPRSTKFSYILRRLSGR